MFRLKHKETGWYYGGVGSENNPAPYFCLTKNLKDGDVFTEEHPIEWSNEYTRVDLTEAEVMERQGQTPLFDLGAL